MDWLLYCPGGAPGRLSWLQTGRVRIRGLSMKFSLLTMIFMECLQAGEMGDPEGWDV